MISKELFCKTLNEIIAQGELDENFGKAIETMGDGYFLFGIENKYRSSLLEVLAAVFQDDGEYISWWLYEDVEKVVWFEDKTEIPLKTAEQLYDFLLDNIAENEKAESKKL